MHVITDFFRGIVREMRKTSWPKRSELVKYSLTVFMMVAIMVVFFYAVDLGISQILRLAVGD